MNSPPSRMTGMAVSANTSPAMSSVAFGKRSTASSAGR
jgi:hypothetical protein